MTSFEGNSISVQDIVTPTEARAKAGSCFRCRKRIGKTGGRMLLPELGNQVWCSPCFNSKDAHRSAYPQCADTWHDMWDHRNSLCTYAAAELILTTKRAVVTAYDLVRVGACSGACLVAAEDGACACPCRGLYHGALADVDVSERDGTREDGTTPV